MEPLTDRQRSILEFIDKTVRERAYPPSVREICEAVNLSSPSTVHSHLSSLQKMGYLRRDPTKPRAIQVTVDSDGVASGNVSVPLVGDVAAGYGVIAEQNIEDTLMLPAQFTGSGELFMLRVRGESMIEAGIFDGDFVVVRQQNTASSGDTVVAGVDDELGTVKNIRFEGDEIVLSPANATMEPRRFPADAVQIYGKVVTVLRKL
ncbi:MAG: transcriptional repressor LexA [Actinobacteria bacterium]|nr:transcriptional repressor LexA [Actinomycetota bacterium]